MQNESHEGISDSRFVVPKTSNWTAIICGVLLLWPSLSHISASSIALNYFDTPKRLLWSVMALVLALVARSEGCRLGARSAWLALGLLAWMIVRTLSRPAPATEIEVLFTWMLPLLMLILGAGIENSKGMRIFGALLVSAGIIQALLMVLQRFGLDPLFRQTTSAMDYAPGRMIGTIGYHNQAVDFLALSASGIFLLSKSSRLKLCFMLFMLFVAGLTANRGGILAFVFALAAVQSFAVWINPLWKLQKKALITASVILGICSVLGAMTLIPETSDRFKEAVKDFRHSPAVQSRVLMNRIGCDMFTEKPWIGWGAGEYAHQYLDRLGNVLPEEKTHEILGNVVFARETHNDYVQFAAEFGLLGFAILAALVCSIVISFIRAGNDQSDAVATAMFILVYMAVASLFSFPWQTGMGGPLAGFLIGWLLPQKETSKNEVLRIWPKISKSALVAFSLILVAWSAVDSFFNRSVPDILAEGHSERAARMLPRFAYRYRALVGAAYAVAGDYEAAEKELTAAQKGYRDILLWNNLGNVYGKLGKWDEAVTVYERWARCGIDYDSALRNLSVAQEQAGTLEEAAETLARRISLWRTTPDEVKRLAVLQMQAGYLLKARETLFQYRGKWKSADPKTVAEIENLSGAISLNLEDYGEAERLFRSALQKYPGLESARRNLDQLRVITSAADSGR